MSRRTIIPIVGVGTLPVDGPIPVANAIAVAVIVTVVVNPFIAEIVAVRIIAFNIRKIIKDLLVR